MPESPAAPNPAPPKQDADYPPFIAAMREWAAPNSALWKSWACGHPRTPRQARQPWEKCISCSNSDKRARRFFFGHVALALIQLALTGAMVAEACR
jgi:hypothetical protein